MVLLIAPATLAFCGFFVAKVDTPLHNTASQVVIAHSGDRSIFMMANNFQGDVKDFARIVPIPVIPNQEQVRIGDLELVNQLMNYTTPRLAQYFDDFNRICENEIWLIGSIITTNILFLILMNVKSPTIFILFIAVIVMSLLLLMSLEHYWIMLAVTVVVTMIMIIQLQQKGKLGSLSRACHQLNRLTFKV